MRSFIHSQALPVVYVIMRNKTTASYRDVFREIKRLVPNMQPRAVIADFEWALHTGIRAAFGENTRIIGCWFHFCQVNYFSIFTNLFILQCCTVPMYLICTYSRYTFINSRMFLQAILRFQKRKLSGEVRTNFKDVLDMTKALPLLPAGDIPAGIDFLEERSNNSADIRALFQYLRRYWIPSKNIYECTYLY